MIFAVLLVVLIFSASASAVDKIRIGFAPGASSTALPLAEKKGLFREEGLEAEVIRMSSTVAAAALASGEADYVIGMSGERSRGCRSKWLLLTYKAAHRHSWRVAISKL
jgi:ABC-type nitrate/sulfonate/bicarbonate transport system substrate-binding protein